MGSERDARFRDDGLSVHVGAPTVGDQIFAVTAGVQRRVTRPDERQEERSA